MSKKIKLIKIAYGRSGDKGDQVNIGIIARAEKDYPLLLKELTIEKVKKHFENICFGEVKRYELPNLGAINFILDKALDGGGSISHRVDAQGKTYAAKLLAMEILLYA